MIYRYNNKNIMPMKRIFLLYLGGFLLSLLFGGVVSVAYYYSWYFLILLAIPISFGYVLLSDLFLRINAENLRKVTILTVMALITMFGFLIVAAYFHLDEKSLCGIACAGGVICYIAGLAVIGMRLTSTWGDRKIKKDYSY
jgi:hypothetical protein